MKKIAAFLSSALLVGILAGCSDNSTDSAPESTVTSSLASSSSQEQAEQTKIEKALALIHTFVSGDTQTARDLLTKIISSTIWLMLPARMPLSVL